MLADPANRLVAARLEVEWNARLSELAAAEEALPASMPKPRANRR
jgi:hypothetical protein